MPFVSEGYYDAQGGITATTTLTNANNGTANGNSNFARVDVGASNTVTAENTWANKSGTLAYKMVQGGSNRPGVYGVFAGARSNPSFSVENALSVAPAVITSIMRFFTDSGFVTSGMNFQISTSRKLLINDSIDSLTSASSTGVLTPGAAYTFVAEYNDTTKISTFTAYVQGTSTVQATISLTSTTNKTFQSWEYGIIATSALFTIDFDRLNVGNGGTATRFDVSNVPPVATQVSAAFQAIDTGAAATVQWNLADSDGTMAAGASIACTTRPSGSASPTVTVSGYTPGSPTATIIGTIAAGQLNGVGRYIFTVSATDSGGGSVTGATTLTIDTAPAINTPTDIRQFNDLNYNQYGSEPNLITAIIDGLVNTGVESPPSPVAELMEIQTGAIKTNGITWRANLAVNGSGSGSYRVRSFKPDKSTLLQTFTGTFNTTPTWYSGQLGSSALAQVPLPADRVGLWWLIDTTVT